LADECLRAVLRRKPDAPEARRLLGYVPFEGGWATPFAVGQLKAGKVLHATYGWVDRSWVPHLERGELPARGAAGARDTRWLPAAEADGQRSTFEHGWTITTEHFQLQTDVPLSEAIAFGRTLEAFHDLFFSRMADVIGEDLPLARRFRDRSSGQSRTVPHRVFYFATRDEFVAYLTQRGVQSLQNNLGCYYPPPKGERRAPAYFFHDQGGKLPVIATLFHEVSHQLLSESSSAATSAYKNNVRNYWVFEGLGTYFETVTPSTDGTFQVGGFVGPRIAVARKLIVGRGEYVPIAQFVRLVEGTFHDPDRENLHYCEAMALAVLLMDSRGGAYREGFLDYVRDAVRGRLRGDGARELDDRLGTNYKALDDELIGALSVGS
jgi:hypothetical protein